MNKITLNINEVDVSCKPVIYTCYGLGSCIGLFIEDRRKRIAGGAHIPLPSEHAGIWMDATTIINILLSYFSYLGSDMQNLRAKITGGSQVYQSTLNLGEENFKSVLHLLTQRRIYIAAKDIGGRISRTAIYNSQTGELHISTSNKTIYVI